MADLHALCLSDPISRRREIVPFAPGASLAEIAPGWQLPYVAIVGDKPVLRADWATTYPLPGTPVVFVALPQGPAAALLTFFIADAAASYIATEMVMAAAVGWTSAAAVTALYAGTYLAAYVATSYVISAAVGTPSAPSNQAMQDAAAASPTYSLTASANQARINQPIPVQYGRMKVFPDLLAAPYAEYRTTTDANGDQYLIQHLMIGQGHYDIEAVTIDDTPIANYSDVSYGILAPGEKNPPGSGYLLTYTTPEVAGGALETNAPVTYVCVPEGRTASYVYIDFVCPKGLYYSENDGSLSSKTVSLTIAVRPVGGPTWKEWSYSITAATTTPQRRTYIAPSESYTPGRLEVRITRTDTKDTSHRAGHEVQWTGARVDLAPPSGFDDAFGATTRMWIVMRASDQLTGQSARKIAVLGTRKLPVWNGTAWSAPQVTRNPAWALADALRASYGANLPDAQIDLAGLLALSTEWAGRSDTFDAVFDGRITVWEAIGKIARAGRARPYMQGGRIRFARDRLETTPVAMFTPANMLEGSFSIQYLMPSDQTAEEIRVRYFSATTWKQAEAIHTLASADPDKFAEVDLFGVTGEAQALREAQYLAQTNRYRRRLVSFDVELEGMILSPLDPILISHDLPDWGQHAIAVGWNAATLTLEVDRDLTWGTGFHFVRLRKRDGSPSALTGSVSRASPTSYRELVFINNPGTIDLSGREPTHIAFGAGTAWQVMAKVLTIRPKDEYTATITAVIEDDLTHTGC